MKRYVLMTLCLLAVMFTRAQQVVTVKAGDAQSLLDAVEEANKRNADKDCKWLYVLIPDGLYDLGEKVLTRVTGHHIAFIGQSMEGTVIQNKPDVKNEGISKTAIFLNRGTDNYFQDLTLKNDLDYYAAGAAGRAVTLQDKGNRTICNRVRLLSYQDTYYSDNDLSQFYFQDSEIHGTVDFICGDGDVWFERCRIVTEKLNPTRFDWRGMNTVRNDFREYGTTDAQGRRITPQSNVVEFKMTRKKQEGDKEIVTEQRCTVETIISEQQAARYTLDNVFGDWKPQCIARQIEKKAKKKMERLK